MKSVLAALDLGSGSEPVATFAATLARALEAELVLLHVISPEEQEERAHHPGDSRFVDVMIKETERLLAELAEGVGAGDLSVRYVALTGDPVDEILAFSADVDGPVVIGMRRRSRVGKFLLGSDLQEILMASTRPVVAVPLHHEG
jgi:nucleotide-binding universal stress UspA family protein